MATPHLTQRPHGSNSQQPRTVRIDGDRQIAYAEYGDTSGDPVVFLHGTPGSRRLGALLGPAATERGVRVLAPDRPGYGRSSPWPNRSVGDASAFVLPVLDDAGVQTARAVAFSGGAPYALSTAAASPARISRVDLVSGATPPTAGADTPAVQRLLAGLATRTPSVLGGLFRGQAWLADRTAPSFVVGQYTANAETVPEAVAETVAADFVEAFARHRSGAVTEFRNTATDWEIELDEIDTDVRLWHGANDTNVPVSGARRVAERLPSAELHVLDDADHLQTLLRAIPDVLEGS